EHQSLLHPERHIDFLDEYAGLIDDRKQFQILYDEFQSLKKEYDDLLRNKERMARERDFFEFQLNEIKSVAPEQGEDEEIERELSILENSEELRNISGELYESLYESEDSVHLRLAKARSLLESLAKIDSHFT